ncbi:MAG: hypothetical protein KDD45_13140, partial [Bdellovibrionales bacterium]|nr:hypothetical protein [Bdellovibrionales bacterium]
MNSLYVYKNLLQQNLDIFIKTILSCLLIIALTSSYAKGRSSAEVGQDSVKTSVGNENLAVSFLKSKKWSRVLEEIDEVQREIVWLLTEKRPLYNKTLFGKIFRAKNQYQKIKLKNKSKHACDNYQIKTQSTYFQVFEYCQKYRAPDILAQVDIVDSQTIKVDFYGQNYTDIIGASAALVSPRIQCRVKVNSHIKLQSFTCDSYKHSRGQQVIELTRYAFDKESEPSIKLEGQVLDRMLPYSKLSVIVPSGEKIKIKETKIRPDLDEYDPSKMSKTVKESKKTESSPSIPNEVPGPVEIQVDEMGQPISPRQQDSENTEPEYIFTPQGEKIIKQSDPDMIELNPDGTPKSG